jgi:hypothetical protein
MALGNIFREPSAKERLAGGVLSSLIGTFAKTLLQKERWRYLALTDRGSAHVLDFADGALAGRHDLELANVRVNRAVSDESLLFLDFIHLEARFQLQLQRYQLPSLAGELLTDPADMRIVGDMTRTIEAAFRR